MGKENDQKMIATWYRRRKYTTMLAIFQKCLFEFEYSAVVVSALFYFKETMRVENAKLYYSITMGVLFVSGTLSAALCGQYMDRSRNLRRITLGTIIFSIIGNLVYAMPFSRWLPIFGRFLCGIADGVQPAISGELCRVYSKKDLSGILSLYETLGGICFSIAPCSPLLFQGIHFNIGILEINQYNFIGLFLATVAAVYSILSFFITTNLTQDPGYALVVRDLFDESSEDKEETPPKKDELAPQQLLTLKDVLKNANILLIICGEGLIAYHYTQLELIINMTSIAYFHWTLTRIGVVTGVAVLIFMLFMLISQSKLLKGANNIYFLYTSCFVLAIVQVSLLNLITVMGIKDVKWQTFLLAVVLLCNATAGFGSTIYSRWLLFSIVPSHSASIIDAYRYIVARMTSCAGYILAAFVFPVTWLLFPLYNVVFYIILVLLLFKREKFLKEINIERG